MESRRALDRLREQQGEIAALLAAVRAALAASDPRAREALASHRWQAVKLLRGYQLFKHTEIFDPMSRHPDRLRADRAVRMKARCLETGQAYTDHVQRWSATGIAAAFDDYRRELLGVVARIEKHLAHEATEAALLLTGVERTRKP